MDRVMLRESDAERVCLLALSYVRRYSLSGLRGLALTVGLDMAVYAKATKAELATAIAQRSLQADITDRLRAPSGLLLRQF